MGIPLGSFFEKIIGKPVPDNVPEMLSSVEAKLGHKLAVSACSSNLVYNRSVIPVSCANMQEVDAEIDRIIESSKKIF